jgi:ribose 5-phosphate isomerase A
MDKLRRAIAAAAVDQVPDGAVVGLGSGSTLGQFIPALGQRVREGRLHVVGVPTSYEARWLAQKVGIPVRETMDLDRVDVAFDGTDELDPCGNLLKGGGAAQVLEKLVAAMAERFIVLADESKLVPVLGQSRPVVVEVAPPALGYTLKQIAAIGGRPEIRIGKGKVGPVVSDLGNLIIDAHFGEIRDPAQLDRQLNALPGVVGHGLFTGMADEAIIARAPANQPSIETIRLQRSRN